MRKSLSIISVLVFCWVLLACHSKPKTTSSTGQNSTAANSNTNTTKKDSTKANGDNKAVIHGTQNQAQLDSLKAAKNKAKK